MSWRTVIISNHCKLDYKAGYMVIRQAEGSKKIFINEISVVVVENPAVSLTGVLLEVLAENKIKVIFCDSKRNPVAELVPHHGSHDSALKIRTQIEWGNTIKGLVWREIVSEKIRNQADFLEELGKTDEAGLLRSYISQVEIGDSTNREGHAAKVYFNAVFGKEFSRSADIPVNAALNYGYSIILSSFNRAISANGYLTQLGVFHNNMFNHYNLGSDLMEPFRIIVDRLVYDMKPDKFETEEKHEIWSIVNQTVVIDGQKRTVAAAIEQYTKSVFNAISENDLSEIRFAGLI